MLGLLSAASKTRRHRSEALRSGSASAKGEHGRRVFIRRHQSTQSELYVGTGDGVYLVSAYYASLVPRASDRMLTHSLFNEREKAIGFKFKGFSVQQQDGKWTLSPRTRRS
jgi:hypothetical protein